MNSEPDDKRALTTDPVTPPRDILIVDDEVANLKLLTALLVQQGYQVRPAERPQLAIDSAVSKPPALILLDVKMPEMDGFEVCKRLKQDERTRNIPIIFISALQEVHDRVQGFEAGGVDFIIKPFQGAEVLARVRTHMDLRHLQLNLEAMIEERTAEFAESEAKYRGLVDNAIVGVFVSTLDGRFKFVNDAMTGMFDFDSPEQMVAEGSIKRWRNPKDRERMMAELQKHGKVTNFEAEAISQKDRNIQLLFSAKQVGSDIVGMGMDITERKRIERELQKSYDTMKHLLSSVPEAVFSVKLPERVIEWAEDSYNTMGLGNNPKHVQGLSTLKYFINSEEHETFGKLQRQAIREGKRYMRTEITLLREDGTPFPAEVTGTFCKEYGKVTSITALARDITERKQAEQKILDYQQRLRALAAQLTISEEKERRQFAAFLHDHVGQALALTRLQIVPVKNRTTDAKQVAALDEISDAMRRILKQARELIYDLSPPQLNEIGLSAAISEWLEERIEKHHEIKTVFIADTPEGKLNETLRAILFRNVREIVTNVIKHAQATHVEVRMGQERNHLRISVRDDGIGFDIESLKRPMKAASGFGIFSIRERMVDLGGSFEIISQPGKGTEAILHTPINADESKGA